MHTYIPLSPPLFIPTIMPRSPLLIQFHLTTIHYLQQKDLILLPHRLASTIKIFHYHYSTQLASHSICVRQKMLSVLFGLSRLYYFVHHSAGPIKSSKTPICPWVIPWQQRMIEHPGDHSFVMLRVLRRKQPKQVSKQVDCSATYNKPHFKIVFELHL